MKLLPALLLTALTLSIQAADITLPPGYRAEIAAAPPLVQHPIMATLGGRGQLFIGDAAGLNLKKAELEEQLPNRVLLLTDTNGDGVYDKTTVFADKMTFPQGGVFLDGALYVASPPGIWRLRDTDGDGVADQREMIAGTFDYTGNAADVHGPFLHPNGRLYWCHGRKGHDVRQHDGTPVHAGLASGIWSCLPDGSDIRWHALGCGDNPVEIDFTPEGEIIGTQNLFYTNPRGDTLVHWLRGGVYPREDQLKAIAGLPRTLDAMPVVHNFGHVGVSGATFYRSGALHPDWRGQLFVTHFNTQRVTRMEVEPAGATFKVAEREFFKLQNPDAHLTDVIEDHDGSLLILDTGGWFRIGCPSSLLAKPDVAGAIYRVRKVGPAAPVERWGAAEAKVWELARQRDAAALVRLLSSSKTDLVHTAANALASLAAPATIPALVEALAHPNPGVQLAAAHALGEMPALEKPVLAVLLRRLGGDVEPVLEHQLMFALLHAGDPAPLQQALTASGQPALQRRALIMLEQLAKPPLTAEQVLPLLEAKDQPLARNAAEIVATHPDWIAAAATRFDAWLAEKAVAPERLEIIERTARPFLAEKAVRELLTSLVQSDDPARRRTGATLLASAPIPQPDPRWSTALEAALPAVEPGDAPLLIDALAKNGGAHALETLRHYSTAPERPEPLRLKALSASIKPGGALQPDSFDLLLTALTKAVAASSRVEAARTLARAKLTQEQFSRTADAIPAAGPLELHELIKLVRQTKEESVAQALATKLATATALSSLQESEVRTAFSAFPPAIFELVAPALRALAMETELRRRLLETLPSKVLQQGRPAEGAKLFASGKGACIGCHRIGSAGNLVGPNLSHIGQIRTERDLLESILFPSATLARDYEAQNIDLADGTTLLAVIRRQTPEALTIGDATGQERTIPRSQVVALQPAPVSLMPSGLDRTLTEQELLDLVSYLRSQK